jgi:hypothetical protein
MPKFFPVVQRRTTIIEVPVGGGTSGLGKTQDFSIVARVRLDF